MTGEGRAIQIDHVVSQAIAWGRLYQRCQIDVACAVDEYGWKRHIISCDLIESMFDRAWLRDVTFISLDVCVIARTVCLLEDRRHSSGP